jgi:pimeloyl-ACP methyl ester carboxylesterase
VAVKTASKYEDIFDKIVLTGAAGIITNRGVKYKIKVKTYRFFKKIAPKFAEKRFGSKEYKTLSPIMKESYKKIVNEDLRDTATRVKNQVLIVCGERDLVTPKKEAEIYERAFPCARLETIDGGHFAFAENPLVFNLLAEEFFYG